MPQSGASRRRPLLGLLGLLLIVAVVIALVVVARRTSSSPSAGNAPTARPTAAVTSSASSGPGTDPAPAALPVGITFGNRLFGLSRSRVDAALAQVVDLHMTWIRIDMNWASLQPVSADTFDWGPLDTIVASARSHHLRVLGLLSYTPSWARSSGCSGIACPPRSRDQFAHFAAAVAGRYRPSGVTDYQIWNEPNLDLFWVSPDPARYRSLLQATVTAMRATGSGLRILFGGLAVAADDGTNFTATTFVRRACAGGTCPVDAVGYDPSTYPALPSATSKPYNAFQLLINPAAGAAGLPAALAAVGLGRTPVWITGFGAPTGGGSRAVTDAKQARILTDGLGLAKSDASRVGGYFVDTLRDSYVDGGVSDHFGLERSDGSRKPAFTALARALAS